jgi:DnaJ-class molecular chaperone
MRAVGELIACRQVSQETPFKGNHMPKLSAKPDEFKCPACKGTGFPAVKQPAQPGRKIYPARCERCDGKGWIAAGN